jgi:hypothetical protein
MKSLFKFDKLTQENNIRYFTQKASSAAWFLLIFGFAAAVMGFGSDSILMGIIGCALVALAAYEFVSVKLRKVTGAELDAFSSDAAQQVRLEKKALKCLCLDVWDLDAGEALRLQGYTHIGIDTAPCFRRDEGDGKLRSSVYQLSYLLFTPERFYAYSYAFSLVDKKNTELGHGWRYSDVRKAGIFHEKLKHIDADGKGKLEAAEAVYLRIEIREGAVYSFAFDGTQDGADQAKRILELIRDPSAIVLPAQQPPQAANG